MSLRGGDGPPGQWPLSPCSILQDLEVVCPAPRPPLFETILGSASLWICTIIFSKVLPGGQFCISMQNAEGTFGRSNKTHKTPGRAGTSPGNGWGLESLTPFASLRVVELIRHLGWPGPMWMAGFCVWTCVALVCPSVVWAGEGDVCLWEKGRPRFGEASVWGLISCWEFGWWCWGQSGGPGGGNPLVAVETQPRQEGQLSGSSRKAEVEDGLRWPGLGSSALPGRDQP